MIYAALAFFVCVAAVWIYSMVKDAVDQGVIYRTPKQSGRPAITMLNRKGESWADEYQTYIAGVPYHASRRDIGGFSGYVANDAGNTHDRNAMGVYNSDGKLLGFVPARELRDYRDWCGASTVPCIGFIHVEDGQLCGRVKMALPCNQDFVNDVFSRYRDWIRKNHGERYVPPVV